MLANRLFERARKRVTAEHLLVGLLRADQSLVARCGLTIDRVPKELTKAPHECRTATGLALSDTAREAILLASEEREHFGHKHTGTEHLLLGIIRGGSDVARMLEQRGLTIGVLPLWCDAGHQTSICSTKTLKARSIGAWTRTDLRTTASSAFPFMLLLSSLRFIYGGLKASECGGPHVIEVSSEA